MLHQNEGDIGKSIPDAQEISRDLAPSGHLRVEVYLEGRGGEFPNNSRVLVELGYSIHHQGVHGINFPQDREGFTLLNPILPCK